MVNRLGTSCCHVDLLFMKNKLATLAFAMAIPAHGLNAAEIRPESIIHASIDAIASKPPAVAAKEPDPSIVHVQILLDRAGSSPGVIDGFYGENVSKAIRGFEALQGLEEDGELDSEVLGRLRGHHLGGEKPVLEQYEIISQDAEDLVNAIPEDVGQMAKLEKLGYTSVAERLSERFHMDIDLLEALNPASAFAVGEAVWVAAPGEGVRGKVSSIEVLRDLGQVRAFAEDGKLLSVYPATIGSEDNPAPSGTHNVNGVAPMPTYTYDPDVNFQQGDNTEVLEIAGGPNNPVGTVWIDLSEPTYGIHGTPEPSLIDKVGSHGCVRLTNWDVEELGAMVDPGVKVEFID
ncbi:murein L,D-transpeptidase [Pseudorhizobium endolithicum]|uniref:Murein L,D-transpeptidase n=2 Tax=Pseudorhizobium endolithicum TaxID=1191678 RepID=A0ABN7JPB8_9HYPH|nr:murein L,D-transpeptidase [Pseudorhizobium endolithicum]